MAYIYSPSVSTIYITNVSRGQSEVVGSLLLAGIVVLTLSAFGVMVFNSVDTGERQLTDIAVTVTTDSITVTHAGGEPIAAANLDVVVGFEGESQRYNAADAGVASPVSTGDRWTIDTSLPYTAADRGSYVSVMVIAVNTGEVLYTDSEPIA